MTKNVSVAFIPTAATTAADLFNSMGDAEGKINLSMLDKGINWIGSNGKKMDVAQHACAVAALGASLEHKYGGHNCTIRAERLLNNMPKGSRVKTLADWMAAFSNMRPKFDKKAGAWVVKNLPSSSPAFREIGPDVIPEALAKPFWVVEEKTAGPAAFDIGQYMGQLLAAAKKADEAGTLTAEQKLQIEAVRSLCVTRSIPVSKAKAA